MRRRQLLQLLGIGTGSLLVPARRALADARPDEFFIFIHAAGGWDVTLWADPRNERRGVIDPPTNSNTTVGGLKHWRARGASFELLGSPQQPLGPALGDLYDLRDRLTIINGLAMNTVSHADGTTFSTTGRHRTGGAPPESSIDVLIANELGTTQLMPAVAVRFPSTFVGTKLDRRAVPLRVSSVDAITQAFARSGAYFDSDDRAAISAVLTDEAQQLARRSTHPEVLEQLASQHADLQPLLGGDFRAAFEPRRLQSAYPKLPYGGHLGANVVAAAFALEALKRNVVRSVAFSIGAFDTHTGNQREHALQLQDLFDLIAVMVHDLERTPHPTRRGAKLADHAHIVVVSEFCRTPQLNPAGGRDHYPNNSALVISPRFRRGTFGATDAEQLLPRATPVFPDPRPITPADLLATFLHAFRIDPRRYMRDGDVATALLA